MKQIEIDFSYRKQNNEENQKILDENLEKLNYQCRLILNILKTGKRITVGEAAAGVYDEWEKKRDVRIGDLRARIRDLRASYEIKDEKFAGGFKIYFL